MKIGLFTDIHFGARLNSDQHLQDCLNYIDWFCDLSKTEKFDCVCFLGDWFENRNQINIRTLDASHEAKLRLNSLGIPVYILTGNHDLYHRSNRNVFSTRILGDLENVKTINEMQELTKDVLVSPFLFRDEYPKYAGTINSYKYVLGHFEFKNFVVTGADRVLDHGPDAALFNKPKFLLSGHFHKRQINKNIIYIGNTFGTSYSDAEDAERGAACLDTDKEDVLFYNYENAPVFHKTKLSRVIAGDMDFKKNSRVRCLIDIDVAYTDVQAIREELIKSFELREFSVEEDFQMKKDAIQNGAEIGEIDFTSLDDTIRVLITEGVQSTGVIDPSLLIEIYADLKHVE